MKVHNYQRVPKKHLNDPYPGYIRVSNLTGLVFDRYVLGACKKYRNSGGVWMSRDGLFSLLLLLLLLPLDHLGLRNVCPDFPRNFV